MALRINIFSTLIISIAVFFLLFVALPEQGHSQSRIGCCIDIGVPECLNCEGLPCATPFDACNTGFLDNSYCNSNGNACVVAQDGDLGCCVRPNNLCLDDVGLEICEGFEGVEWVFNASCSSISECPGQNQGVNFFTDEELFSDTCRDLNFEDFEGSNAPNNMSETCPNPFNSFTNNACYSAGVLIPGFSVIASNPPNPAGALLVLAPGAFGSPNTAVGAQSGQAATATVVELDDSNAAGIEFTVLNPGAPVNTVVGVDVYGPGNTWLGTTGIPVNSGNTEHFVGVTSVVTPIERIELNAIENLQFITSLSFGQCDLVVRNVPTMSEWALIATAGILAIVALIVIRRRAAA